MRAMRRIFRIAASIAAIVLGLILAAAALIHTPPAKNYLRKRAVEYVRRHYGAELKINQLDFNMLKGAVSVEGLSFGTAAPDLIPLLKLKSAYINVGLLQTLLGSTSIEYVRLDNPDVHLVIGKDGRMNLPDFGSGGGGGGDLLIRKLEISDGSLNVEDLRQQIGLLLPSWQVQIQRLGAGAPSALHLKTNKSGIVKYLGKQFEIDDLELKAELSSEILKIQKLSLEAAGSKATGSGDIRNYSSPVFDLKIDTEIDLEQAASVIGMTQGMKGRARGTIKVTGPLKNLKIGGDLQGNIADVFSNVTKSF